MTSLSVNELAARQIHASAMQALTRVGVLGILPTPLEAVSRVVGIEATINVADIPSDLVARRPNLLKRILGAIWYPERTIFVDREQPEARARFVEAHEITHGLIPWHEAIFRLDDEARIFGETKRRLDLEADLGAAELLFQGDLFAQRAQEYRVGIAAPIALAADFGVSLTAATRFYPAHNPDSIAVIMAGRIPRWNQTVPIWASHESPSFRRVYGSAAELFADALPATASHPHPIGELVASSLKYGDVYQGSIHVSGLDGQTRELRVEALSNGRVVLVLLAEVRAANRLGRRVGVQSA